MVLPKTQEKATAAPKDLSAEDFQFLCRAIHEDSGIVLDESKGYLVEARLIPLAKSEGVDTLDGLCRLLRATGGRRVRELVVQAMTTNETLFFRDVKPFEALEKVLLPELTSRPIHSRRLRVWSAACSSGQEAYSLAMLWLEMNMRGWELEIFGTDLSDAVLARARAGRFQQLEVNRGLPAKYLVKYFTRQGMEWEIKPEVRKMVRWTKFNLKDSMSALGHADLVFCRNVLIYFDLDTKRKILANIRKVLVPGGYLILGSSETTMGTDQTFIRKQVGPAVMYQNP